MKTVLVTAAGSGIGQATALELDKLGFKVFAGVRKKEHGEKLSQIASSNLEAVILDVTQTNDITDLKEKLRVSLGNKGLYALVNVAGIADFGPIEALSIDRFRQIFDVNLFGTLELTQAMLPFIRKSKGRIVNVGSVGAHTTIPFGVTICASKHALESLNSGLRIELKPWGIDVIAVDPSSIATPAANRMLDQAKETIGKMTMEQRELYAKPLLSMAESMHKQEMTGAAPETVGKVIAKALLATKPRTRYPVGPNSKKIILLSRLLPDRLFDRLKLKMVGIKMKV